MISFVATALVDVSGVQAHIDTILEGDGEALRTEHNRHAMGDKTSLIIFPIPYAILLYISYPTNSIPRSEL